MRTFLFAAVTAASAIATSLTVADAAPRHVVPTASYVQDLATPFLPSPWFTSADPRLSQIEMQLNQAERTINADQRRGYITASEAQSLREQDRLIRSTALDDIRRNHGQIPDLGYTYLLGRVSGLDQAIQMDTQRG